MSRQQRIRFTPLGSRRLLVLSLLAAGASVPSLATAAPTRAGTVISNTASATYTQNGATTTINSNTVELTVDEVLDVTVTAVETAPVAARAGSTGNVLSFIVTNAGNGPEAFRLTANAAVSGDDFDPIVTALAIDSDGNGVYDPNVDTAVPASGLTALLDPEQKIRVFVVTSVPAGTGDQKQGRVGLRADADTGTGAPGTVFPGKGVNGDAIVGSTTAEATATSGLLVSATTVALVKSASVKDPFGGTRTVPGSIVTYRLVATIGGSGDLSDLKVSDAIPAGTAYQAGTLKLDGAGLTDAADSDAGTAGAGGIAVTLPTTSAGSSRQIEFNVKVD
jgi:uncharacterized repeat protein (TIGR01451 family)